MSFEIEFLPVGEASRAGDAIVVRYVDNGTYRIIVIDGGTDASGDAVVEHIRTYYGQNAVVSDVVSTHPDTDHACGLRAVLRDLPVERLWIHGLWHHAPAIVGLFSDSRWTMEGLSNVIRQAYPVVQELIDLAVERGVRIQEPFRGAQIGPFTVLSPNEVTYQHLIPQFRKTPDADVELLKQRGIWLGAPKGFWNRLIEGTKQAIRWVRETWTIELLREGCITAAENESSTVLLGNFGGLKVLLTADAGVNALSWAAEYASTNRLWNRDLRMIQIPHHGSRSNVTPSLLDRLIGPILPEGSDAIMHAVVSAPKDDSTHPRVMVLNAFTRRGAEVFQTKGQKFRYHSGSMPSRNDEMQAIPVSFDEQVEDYD